MNPQTWVPGASILNTRPPKPSFKRLNYNWDCCYANEFPVAVEEPDVGSPRTIAHKTIDLIKGHSFGRKVFWDSNPEWFS